MTHEETGNKQGNYTKPTAWRDSRLWHKEHGVGQREPRDLPELRWSWEFKEAKMPPVHRASTREEKAAKTENSGEVLEFLKSSADQPMCVRKLPKNHRELERIIPKAPLVPTSQSGNLIINSTSGRVI